jgi:hypothetical protein
MPSVTRYTSVRLHVLSSMASCTCPGHSFPGACGVSNRGNNSKSSSLLKDSCSLTSIGAREWSIP